MAEAGDPPSEFSEAPTAGSSPTPPASCTREKETPDAGAATEGAADGEPNAVPIVGVSGRFNVGHLLVAVGLFAALFGFLQLLGAPPFLYVLCGLFCVAIPLGQVFLYQGRQPRRASCLVGARLLPVLYFCGLTVVWFQELADELRSGPIDGTQVAAFLTAMLTAFIVVTAVGYVLGYAIGAISAGVFLLVDRKWDAGNRVEGAAKLANSSRAGDVSASPIPPTGKWWLDWMAWSAVLWFWQNSRRPVRVAIALTLIAAVFYVLGIPFVWGSPAEQAYLLGVGVLVPLFGLTVSGVLYAGWRPSLVCCPLGMAAVAYPLFYVTRQNWLWSQVWQQYNFADVSFIELTVWSGLVVGLIAAGFYGWVRWTLAGRGGSVGRRCLGPLINAGFIVLLVLNAQYVVGLVRHEIRYLGLENQRLSEEKMRALAQSPNLVWLHLFDCEVDRGSIKELGVLSKLEYLGLEDCDIDDEELQYLRCLRSLEALHLPGTNISDAGLEHLASVRRLRGLRLDGADFTGQGLKHLKSLPQLVSLDLDGSGITDADLRSLRHFSSLQYLYLSNTNISDAGLEHLATIVSLQELSLDGTNVEGPGLAHLKDLKILVHLELGGTPIDDDGLSHLPPLPALQWLDLSDTQVTGDGLVHIKRLPALRELDVDACDIRDDDLKVLYDFPIWSSGKQSGLSCLGADVTQEGREALEDAWRAHEESIGETPDAEPNSPNDE